MALPAACAVGRPLFFLNLKNDLPLPCHCVARYPLYFSLKRRETGERVGVGVRVIEPLPLCGVTAVEAIAVVVLPGLAIMWGIRKDIKNTNKS